ncbi:unnamed protein product [Urochloa decumbens]|uniref:Uncharacterized protein n=1 Tax=Urochloa decumbens TaxID=240449 RepID=A0ABC8YDD6_9POAL
MPPAEEEGVAPAAASASRRRRVSWGAVFCFGSRRERGEEALEEGTPPWWQRWFRRRKRRTVPVVDGDLVVPGSRSTACPDVTRRGADDDKEPRKKGFRLLGYCFLTPAARTPAGRKHSTTDSGSGRSTHDKRQRQPENDAEPQQPPTRRSPSPEAPARSLTQANDVSRSRRAAAATRTRTRIRPSDNEELGKSESSARGPPCRLKALSAGAGAGAFGPVVGLSVVAAVSMAGLLGGRLWAVACVCAWLAALSGIRQREAGSGTPAGIRGGEEAVAHVDSRDCKKLISKLF